jgi:amidase
VTSRLDPELCFLSAARLAELVRTRSITARDVMTAHLAQIARVNPAVNAIVAKLPDAECLALADEADRRLARREPTGPLHGLPIAFKDLQAAVGFPCTRGSPIFKSTMPAEDSVLVDRLRRAGAIPIGKTNVPEFAMGSHTYNQVYGTTRNPYDLTKSAGGSSGGAAASLATGMLPIADGSDLGGSLRNPANFNNIVALRPSPGLVPRAANLLPAPDFGVNGPMARTVDDVLFLLRVMSDAVPGGDLNRDVRGTHVAWCPDLGGLPLDPRVRTVLEESRGTFDALGCDIDEACPDLSDADSIFLPIRAYRTAAEYGPLLAAHRGEMKPEAVAEIEAGMAVTSNDLGRAIARHRQLLERMTRFQERYAFVVCAVNQVPPFEAALDWPKSIGAVVMEHYVAWMKSAYWISVTCRPAISVPAGFTSEGLPVGIQIVGREGDDWGVLQMARAFEEATGFGRRRPVIAAR